MVTGLEVINGFNMKGNRSFIHSEFPSNTLNRMEGEVIEELFGIRKDWGKSIFPASLVAGHVRESGTSQHSTDGGKKLSKATDFFPVGNVIECWHMIQETRPNIGGLGIYFDTNRFNKQPGPMIHIDIRKRVNNRAVKWFRCKINGKVEYFTLNTDENWKMFYHHANEYLKNEVT